MKIGSKKYIYSLAVKNLLKGIVKEILAFIVRSTGIPFFIRNIYSRNKTTILLYHNPLPDVLEKHLNYLSKSYNFISLDNLVNAIHSKDKTKLPPNSLVITIDDGYKENYELLRIFKRFKITPTIYICSSIVNSNRHFWMIHNGKNSDELKRYSNKDRLNNLKEKSGFLVTKEFGEKDRHALNANELELMKGFVDFQSHTLFHPTLTTCSYDECKAEIFQSKKGIETILGKECRHFSYPNGDYTEREIELTKKAGYLSGRTIDVGWNDINTNPYKLKITGVADKASINMLIAEISGVIAYLSFLRRGSFNGQHPTIEMNE